MEGSLRTQLSLTTPTHFQAWILFPGVFRLELLSTKFVPMAFMVVSIVLARSTETKSFVIPWLLVSDSACDSGGKIMLDGQQWRKNHAVRQQWRDSHAVRQQWRESHAVRQQWRENHAVFGPAEICRRKAVISVGI